MAAASGDHVESRRQPEGLADSLQLAAAFVAAERRPASLEVITLDDRLRAAARKEGFTLIDVPADFINP